jgi:succinoglycan biosynthesis transport protein ExoP
MDARSELPATTTTQYAYADTYAVPPAGTPLGGVTQALATLRRAWCFPVLGALMGLTIALCYIALAPTLYKSTARILLDTSMGRYLQASKLADEPIFDEAQIASQIYILSSESIILPVIRSMDLVHDSEFVGSPASTHSTIWQPVRERIKRLKGLMGGGDDTRTVDPETALEQKALETFSQRLSVYREDVPSVITIAFSSKDPNKAAEIANAITDTYITSTVENKLKSTKLIGQWLQDRMTDLKAQSAGADQALQDYNTTHNLVNTGKGLLGSEQLSDLNAQLANARIAVAQAKARLDGINPAGDSKRVSGAGASNNAAKAGVALNNSDILKLRSELRDVTAKATQAESEFGRNHAAAIKLRKQMDELRASIHDQEQLIADTYANEYETVRARENELASAVAKLVGQVRVDSQAQVKMRELESSAETLRALYNSVMQKYKELNTLQTESLPVESARIITKAVPPLYKSNKKSAAVLAGGVMLGFLLGAGAALGREWAADVFRTPKAVEEWTNIHCVVLPMIDRKRRGSRRSNGSTPLQEYVLDAPFSRFAESLRSVKASIGAAQLLEGAKVIGIVSSLPGEGKTTIAANLAALIVASSGARTLLIDGDVHLRRLTAELAPNARQGLIEALVEPTRLDSLVVERKRSGLDVLPCVLPSRVPNAAEVLGSPKMQLLIAEARKIYDYVIIEIAPIMSVADIKLVERFVDRFVFVVEWGQTKRSLVLEALTELQVIRDRILGIVLNKADSLALRSIEANKGSKFGTYYLE